MNASVCVDGYQHQFTVGVEVIEQPFQPKVVIGVDRRQEQGCDPSECRLQLLGVAHGPDVDLRLLRPRHLLVVARRSQ